MKLLKQQRKKLRKQRRKVRRSLEAMERTATLHLIQEKMAASMKVSEEVTEVDQGMVTEETMTVALFCPPKVSQEVLQLLFVLCEVELVLRNRD